MNKVKAPPMNQLNSIHELRPLMHAATEAQDMKLVEALQLRAFEILEAKELEIQDLTNRLDQTVIVEESIVVGLKHFHQSSIQALREALNVTPLKVLRSFAAEALKRLEKAEQEVIALKNEAPEQPMDSTKSMNSVMEAYKTVVTERDTLNQVIRIFASRGGIDPSAETNER